MSDRKVEVFDRCRVLSHLLFTGLFCLGFFLFSAVGFARTITGAPPCADVQSIERVKVRGYVFESLEPTNSDGLGCVRIYHRGKVIYEIADNASRYELGQKGDPQFKVSRIPNGADLTGDGRPNMIVTSWSGGAHCCLTHYIFELEPKLRLLATIQDGDADLAHFEVASGRRGYYYVTNDIWSYWPASFASSTSHKVILRWNGERFQLDLDKLRYPPPSSSQWSAALKDVNDALNDVANTRDALGTTLWDTTLDLIYTGHSDLAWQFVRAVNPVALEKPNASLEEFCSELKASRYWLDLKPTIKNMPRECAEAPSKKDARKKNRPAISDSNEHQP